MADKVTNGKTVWNILNDAELNAAWRYLQRKDNASHTALALILATGMRPDEARRVTWRDWSPDNQIAVRSSKSDRALPRMIALNAFAQDILRGWQQSAKSARTFGKNRQICTSTQTRKAISTRAIRYAAERLGQHLDIDALKPYDFRHTFAVIVVAKLGAGAARDLLGHKSTATTLRYVHARPRDREAAADLMTGSPS